MIGSQGFNLSQASRILGYSRQAYYKPQALKQEPLGLEIHLSQLVRQERVHCPGKGCRSIYNKYADTLLIGRDKAEQIMGKMGLMLIKKSKYIRTTQAGRRVFKNLLTDLYITGINQVWQCDMTYYQIHKNTYYLIFITDVYSQRIIGQGVYERCFAQNFVKVLLKAIKLRQKANHPLDSLIHHSDGGKQYEAACYRRICEKNNIRQSMCYYSWENPFAEKTNDLIKNRYLKYWKPSNLQELKELVEVAVLDHNLNQPKAALKKLSPIDFEKTLNGDQTEESKYTLELKPSQPKQQ
jgi:transposase InsO family protein